MPKFIVKKHLALDFLGEEWKGAFIDLSAATFNDATKIAALNKDEAASTESSAQVVAFLQEHFLAGKAWDGKELVDLVATDLADLPVEVVNKAVEATVGTPSPNS